MGDVGYSTDTRELRTYTWLCYGLFIAGAFLLLPGVIALILLYGERARAREHPVYHAHFQWLLKTFWISVPLVLLGVATAPISIGWLILVLWEVWYWYRLAKGVFRYARQRTVGPSHAGVVSGSTR